jgi:methionyl-tRNA formyltransferase
MRNDRLLAGCAQGSAIELIEVQPESRKSMAGVEFARGMRLQRGDRLGS